MSGGRKNVMLGTAGHVDHGKTALVKLLTGCATDRLAAEQQRGLTIELGFAPCRMSDERIVGIVDVPGHVDFIRNMAAGAQGVDVVMLVVAADDAVMPQTREHLDILTLMGVRSGIVALTKIDLVDDSLRELAAMDVRDALAGTFLEDVPICPVSNITGEGFAEFYAELDKVVAACEPRRVDGPLRMWLERSFRVHGFGAVASGIPAAGQVRVGDRLQVWPGGDTGRVRRLEVYGRDEEVGRCGECVAANVSDMSPEVMARGNLVCEPGSCEPHGIPAVELALLPGAARPLPHNLAVHVHVGTAHVQAKVSLLEADLLEPGTSGLAQLRLSQPLPLVAGERFIVRANLPGADGRLSTVGGGRVLEPAEKRYRRRRESVLARLRARAEALGDPDRWAELVLEQAAGAWTLEAWAWQANLRPGQIGPVAAKLEASGELVRLPDGQVVHRRALERIGERLVGMLAAFHEAHPQRAGTDPEPMRQRLEVSRELFGAVCERMEELGKVQRPGRVIASAEHAPQLSNREHRVCEQLLERVGAGGLAPPRAEELAEGLGEPRDRVERLLGLLAERGELLLLDPQTQTMMHPAAVDRAAAVVRQLFAEQDSFMTTEFRDRLGVSRKYAVPLLDYFDRVRLTVRHASKRTPGAMVQAQAPG
ncbi:MAG: selenocysteine-specific translation elongation factor [Phycisphaeraceae bacterium]